MLTGRRALAGDVEVDEDSLQSIVSGSKDAGSVGRTWSFSMA